jgi:hypothetical protein
MGSMELSAANGGDEPQMGQGDGGLTETLAIHGILPGSSG